MLGYNLDKSETVPGGPTVVGASTITPIARRWRLGLPEWIAANSETSGLGFGLGGFVLRRNEADQLNRKEVNGGVGGGGSSRVRPVAVIRINPQGVKVTPIIDVTKICLAIFGTFSALFVAIHKMKRMGK